MEAITTGLGNLMTCVSTVVTFMTDNPVTILYLVGGVAGIAFGVFGRAKRTAR